MTQDERDDAMMQAILDQKKAGMREAIIEMGEDWPVGLMEIWGRMNPRDDRPLLATMARFAEIGLMTVISEAKADCA
jgi:hypothetical protein